MNEHYRVSGRLIDIRSHYLQFSQLGSINRLFNSDYFFPRRVIFVKAVRRLEIINHAFSANYLEWRFIRVTSRFIIQLDHLLSNETVTVETSQSRVYESDESVLNRPS